MNSKTKMFISSDYQLAENYILVFGSYKMKGKEYVQIHE